jgi:hypothetical protein
MAQEAVGGPTSDMKDKTSIITQADLNQAVLGLLTVTAMDYGSTFSVYTSKKGRTWVAFKTWDKEPYSSACEVPIGGDRDLLGHAILVAGAAHLVKMNGKGAKSDSWRDLKQTVDAWESVAGSFPWRVEWETDLGSFIEAMEEALSPNARQEPKDS